MCEPLNVCYCSQSQTTDSDRQVFVRDKLNGTPSFLFAAAFVLLLGFFFSFSFFKANLLTNLIQITINEQIKLLFTRSWDSVVNRCLCARLLARPKRKRFNLLFFCYCSHSLIKSTVIEEMGWGGDGVVCLRSRCCSCF